MMLNLQRLAIFVAVVEAGSFTAAADSLGLTKAVTSFNIKQLEGELGVALLLRTTRRLTLTEAGEVFYHRSLGLLYQADDMLQQVQQRHQGFSGELQITSTPEYGTRVVIPALAAFKRHHPALRIRHFASSLHTDLIAGRVDVAIRLGSLTDSTHRAARLSHFAILPVASPGWLAENPIDSLKDLEQAEWLVHNRLPAPLRWQVTGPGPESETLQLAKPTMVSADSASALMAFAQAGCGVALLPEWLVRPALQAGELQHLLSDYHFPLQGVYALYPDTRHVPLKVRAFIDFLRLRIGSVGT